jgi:hypothetical protein
MWSYGTGRPEVQYSEIMTDETVPVDNNPSVEGQSQLRARAMCIALIGVVPLTLFVQWSDLTVGGTMVAGPFPPLAACLLWALLLAVNTLAARAGRRLLTRRELLVVLAIWLIANMVAGRGLLHPLLASIVGPTYYARSPLITNALATNIPAWFAITDKPAARAFYEGHGIQVPWRLWLRPLLTWTLFLLPFLTANICLCALFERIWVRHERLAYPLVALPIELSGYGSGGRSADPRAAFAAMRVPFWFGLALPVLLHAPGIANAYLPGVPCIPLLNDVSNAVTTSPWQAIRPLYINLYPILIGLTFLAPIDVTLGVWLFLVVNKLEMVLTAVSGWSDGQIGGSTTSVPPYVEEQSAGAFLALAGILVWHARKHLRRIAAALRPGNGAASEVAAYRPLALGFVIGVAGVLAWCVVTGLPLWLAALFFGFYLAVALVLSRLMAEGGVSWILAPILPDKLILSLFGSASVSPAVITRLMFQTQHLRDTRQMLAPAVFQAGKLRDVTGFPLRRFYALLLAAIALTLVVGAAAALPIFYEHGALSLMTTNDGLLMSANVIPVAGLSQANARLLTPVKLSPGAGIAVCTGALITLALSWLRLRFFWWPLHPLGYALTGTLQLGYANKMLFSIFAGWALKLLTLRFGGARGFRYLRGAAFGLILGDLLMGAIIKVLDAVLGPSGYAIF